MMEKKRSKGVTIIGVYCVVVAIIGFLIFYVLFKGFLVTRNQTEYTTRAILYLIWFLVQSILYVIFGRNLLSLKNWARMGLVYLHGILLALGASSLITALHPEPRTLVSKSLSIIISLLIIFYLTRPKVKEQFK